MIRTETVELEHGSLPPDWRFSEAHEILSASIPDDAMENFETAEEKAMWCRPSEPFNETPHS